MVLGTRVGYELVLELAAELSATATVIETVARYAALNPASVRALGADKLPMAPLTAIPPAEKADK
jgi:hypothetical protein